MAQLEGSTTGPAVLVVDDDPDVRELMTGLFRKAGFAVITASSGQEAIVLLDQVAPPGVIFVDLLMPGIVGHELLEYLKSESGLCEIPVAIVSGSPDTAPVGYPLFTKPICFAALLKFVHDSGGMSGALPA